MLERTWAAAHKSCRGRKAVEAYDPFVLHTCERKAPHRVPLVRTVLRRLLRSVRMDGFPALARWVIGHLAAGLSNPTAVLCPMPNRHLLLRVRLYRLVWTVPMKSILNR